MKIGRDRIIMILMLGALMLGEIREWIRRSAKGNNAWLVHESDGIQV